jgi:hypothetical protein
MWLQNPLVEMGELYRACSAGSNGSIVFRGSNGALPSLCNNLAASQVGEA